MTFSKSPDPPDYTGLIRLFGEEDGGVGGGISHQARHGRVFGHAHADHNYSNTQLTSYDSSIKSETEGRNAALAALEAHGKQEAVASSAITPESLPSDSMSGTHLSSVLPSEVPSMLEKVAVISQERRGSTPADDVPTKAAVVKSIEHFRNGFLAEIKSVWDHVYCEESQPNPNPYIKADGWLGEINSWWDEVLGQKPGPNLCLEANLWDLQDVELYARFPFPPGPPHPITYDTD